MLSTYTFTKSPRIVACSITGTNTLKNKICKNNNKRTNNEICRTFLYMTYINETMSSNPAMFVFLFQSENEENAVLL